MFRHAVFAIIAVSGLALHSFDCSAAKRVALVIGNSAYKHASPLENPKNDAVDIAATFKLLGVTVIEGFDLDKQAMDRKIREFSTALAGAEASIFFFAGHGLQVNGHNYLVPIDAELSTATALEFEMVRLDLVQRVMEAETKTSIIFLDACRNNPLARNLSRTMGTRSAAIGSGLAAAESGVGTLVSFSTQPGNVALDGSGRNSPYTAALVKRIRKPGEDLLSVLIAVRNDVIEATAEKQVPWENHAMRAKFYFNQTAPTQSPVELNSQSSGQPNAQSATAPRHSAPPIQPTVTVTSTDAIQHKPAPVKGAAACSNRGELQYCVSSVLPTGGVNSAHYGPRNLSDGDKDTAWVEGHSGDGVGEWVVISWQSERRLSGLRMVNGFAKTERLFELNSRIKKARLEFSSGPSLDVALRDVAAEQQLTIDPSVRTRWIRLQILAVTAGSKYTDTAISELVPILE